MIALACFLPFIQFLISSLIQILSLAWKAAKVILASVITVMKKERILPNADLTGVAQNAFLKDQTYTFSRQNLAKAIHWIMGLALGGRVLCRVGPWWVEVPVPV